VLVNITGGRDLTLHEVNEAASVVVTAAGEEANVIFGSVIDPNLDGELIITVIATGFGHVEPRLKLVDQRPTDDAAAEEFTKLSAFPRADAGKPRWPREREGSRTASLEVPAFLRRQMD